MVTSVEETIELLGKWQGGRTPLHVEVSDAGLRTSFDGTISCINPGALELRSPGCHLVLILVGCSFEYESEATLSAGEKDYMTSLLKVVNPRSPGRSVAIFELAK
jgi:hypothetical protein